MVTDALPITILPGQYRVAKFRWTSEVDTIVGKRTVEHEGELPVTIEKPLIKLLNICHEAIEENKRLKKENAELWKQIEESEKHAKHGKGK